MLEVGEPYLHLTELGWNRISSDEKSRALEALPLPTVPGKFCILDRDGSNVLVGLSSTPKSPMILIPDSLLIQKIVTMIPSEMMGFVGTGPFSKKKILDGLTYRQWKLLKHHQPLQI